VDLVGDKGQNDWFISQPVFVVTANDTTSQVGSIGYNIENGGWNSYTAPVKITREGLYSISVQVSDNATNTTAHTFQLGYDITPPQTSATLTEIEGGMVVTLNRWDGVSGYALTRMAINGVWQDYHHPVTITGVGEYWVQYFTTDFAGNIEAEKITSFTIAETGVVITQNPPVVNINPPANPPNTPPFETDDDFPPNVGDETIFYVSPPPPPVIISTPPTFSDDNRTSNNGEGQHTTNTNTTTLSDNPRISRPPFIREDTETTRLSDVFPLEAHLPPQKNPVRVSPMEYVEHPLAFVSTPSTSVVYTAPPQSKPTTSSPLDVTMLAVLGMTMAGAGIMKSQTAISKQKEQIQVDSLAQSQLASAKAQQNATASANWAQNQTMQANAYQWVVGQVTQSEANRIHFENLSNWQRDVRQKRIEEIMAIILNTTVSITLIPRVAGANTMLSLGTIANYNGMEVLVTHDHYSDPPNQKNSLPWIQRDYSHIYLSGASGQISIDTMLLKEDYKNNGIMFLSLPGGAFFGVTPMIANIAFNYRPQQSEVCHYGYIYGFNRDEEIVNINLVPNNGLPLIFNYVPHSAIDTESRNMIAQTDNVNGFKTEWGGNAGPGDSGTGLFNSNGELIGVFQNVDSRGLTMGDVIGNLQQVLIYGAEGARERGPMYGEGKFNLILP